MAPRSPLVDNAVRLMKYLSRLQELRSKPVRDLKAYAQDGQVEWLHSIPEHEAVRLAPKFVPGEPILIVQRLEPNDAPIPDGDIQKVLGGSWDDPYSRPQLKEKLDVDENEATFQRLFDLAIQWLDEWDLWAEQEKTNRRAASLHDSLFALRRDIEKANESYELVLGFGLLTWNPSEHDPVCRHLFTVPVEIEFNDANGALSVKVSETTTQIRSELDMLDPSTFDKSLPSRLRELTSELDPITISDDSAAVIGRTAANLVSHNGTYNDTWQEPGRTEKPVVSFSPAIIRRKRGQLGFANAFAKIADHIDNSGSVPPGLIPLLDPNQPPEPVSDPSPGAIIEADGEIFSPLPLNRQQENVLKRVDTNAQTVVQGPPGTGKTHTAAALITHLLAQGKRILVTAHTDRALYEVRGKLPPGIQELAVSAIGHSAKEMSDLTGSINKIASMAEEFDLNTNIDEEQTVEEEVHSLQSQRGKLLKKLVSSLEDEAKQRDFCGYSGTKAELIRQHSEDTPKYRWILEYHGGQAPNQPPLTNSDAHQLLALLRDEQLKTAETELSASLLDTSLLVSPEEFNSLANTIRDRAQGLPVESPSKVDSLSDSLFGISEEITAEISQELASLYARIVAIYSMDNTWLSSAIREMLAGAVQLWVDTTEVIRKQLERAQNKTHKLIGAIPEVNGSWFTLAPQAKLLREFLVDGGNISLKKDGSAKTGLLQPAAVRESATFLESVRIDGQVPTSVQQIDSITAYFDIVDILKRVEAEIPSFVDVPSSSSILQQIASYQKVVALLDPAVSLAQDIERFSTRIVKLGLPPVGWHSSQEVEAYRSALNLSIQKRLAQEAREPLESLASRLRDAISNGYDAEWTVNMVNAVAQLDKAGFARAHEQREHLLAQESHVLQLRNLSKRLSDQLPALASDIVRAPFECHWDERLGSFEEAISWLKLTVAIDQRQSLDTETIQLEVASIDDRLRDAAASLAILRAWREAVGRLSHTSRAHLTNYVQQTRKLGKGTGKYAAEQRARVKVALDDSREFVPVWIMPLNRVVDQIEMEQNVFDVVLIDEASQAGMEAAVLQFLAPKIVVIGDDMQVSPSAIGVDHGDVNNLAAQYLADIPFRDALADVQRSFFDDARMRFSGQITLIEHRRSVPEIINFSNRIAYEPERIKLEPVRQVGVERLDPIKVVYAPHGYVTGSGNGQKNVVEANAIVNTIAACLEIPEYDGLTFGVISLTGTGQVDLIQRLLSDRIAPETVEERQLTVGIPPDFQGAERDVIFLSMVSSLTADGGLVRRINALTSKVYVQRFNVAASRAKDQLWVFHSLRRSDVHTPGDMRHELLDYAYSVAKRTTGSLSASLPVDEHNPVKPFDSLFEQRVHNRIATRGYSVTPQVEALGYRIDLVVKGTSRKLAVECDGDYWHSREKYAQDLARQRNLERAGWRVFRVRESDFYADQFAALEPLWDLLEAEGIEPGDDARAKESAPSGNFYRVSNDGQILKLAHPGDSNEQNIEVIGDVNAETSALKAVIETTDPPYFKTDTTALAQSPSAPTTASREQLPADKDIHDEGGDEVSRSEVEEDGKPDHGRIQTALMVSTVMGELERKAFTQYPGVLPRALDSDQSRIAQGFVDILQHEGPARGEQIFDSYVRASGGRRSKNVDSRLQSGLNMAKRQGIIVEDNPASERLVLKRTFRLPHQPETKVRTRGPRKLEDVPDDELLIVIRHYAKQNINAEELMRKTLKFYDLKRLTTRYREFLQPLVEKVQTE